MLRSLCSIPCLLITNAGSILSNSFPFTLFLSWAQRKIAAPSYDLGAAFCFFFFFCVCRSEGIGDLEQSVSLQRSGWDFVWAVGWGGNPSLPGEESDFIIQLETWWDRVHDWIFRSASEVFLFFVLRCVRQIPVIPGKKEIWVKRRAMPCAL